MQLNFFPISFDFERFQISKTTYSDEALQELRRNHNRTNSFFRNRDDIYFHQLNPLNIAPKFFLFFTRHNLVVKKTHS
ncbi:hypothetical protein ASU31_25725 [Pedobacter ginsenosidimutans]|uniref:Uncharacterized protein n=1 Tax=Pedobacter ginsenosidimutans TaxID=687842 RepID=A0A0T5VI00_9SPHI|nr:hypothetical protein ASU31_25725 [Pedobacter ginsenosidimutans]